MTQRPHPSQGVQWLTYSEALALCRDQSKHGGIQNIFILADTANLPNSLPPPVKLVMPKEGPPSPMNLWVGRTGTLVFTVQCEARPINASGVFIEAPFPLTPNPRGDWATLMDLQTLPTPFFVTRPLYIASRHAEPVAVVCRPDPQGWNQIIYNACSHAEAERLLEFLRTDPWNATCVVMDPEPKGKWAIVQDEEAISGYSPRLNDALRCACELSLRSPSKRLVVRDISGVNGNEYSIVEGHVVRDG